MKVLCFIALLINCLPCQAAGPCSYDRSTGEFTDFNNKKIKLVFAYHRLRESYDLLKKQMNEISPRLPQDVRDFLQSHVDRFEIESQAEDLSRAISRRNSPISWIATENPAPHVKPFEAMTSFTETLRRSGVPSSSVNQARTVYFGSDLSAWYLAEKNRRRLDPKARGKTIPLIAVDTGRDPRVDRIQSELSVVYAKWLQAVKNGDSSESQKSLSDRYYKLAQIFDQASVAEYPQRDRAIAKNLLHHMSRQRGMGYAEFGTDHRAGVVQNLLHLCRSGKSGVQTSSAHLSGRH